MVKNIGVGDGQDDLDLFLELFREQALEVDDVGLSSDGLLGVHSMVGRRSYNCPQVKQPSKLVVEGRVEIEGLGVFRGELVLHIVGQREVKEIRSFPLDEGSSRLENKEAGGGAVDLRGRLADQLLHP